MKTLLLLRHAEALSGNIGESDKDRKLSPQGRADAKALGAAMAKKGLVPDLVLCSSAVRTRETFSGLSEGLSDLRGDYVDAFYNAPAGNYLSGIQGASDSADCLLIIGHNPGIHVLAGQLALDDGSPQIGRLNAGYAPATLSVLTCDIAHWADIQMYENRLSALLETVEYNGPERPTRWM